MSIHIVGTGYTKSVEIGESFLQECVINRWDFAPEESFVYYSASGSQMILQEITKVSSDKFNAKYLKQEEITKEIADALVAKGNRILLKSLTHLHNDNP